MANHKRITNYQTAFAPRADACMTKRFTMNLKSNIDTKLLGKGQLALNMQHASQNKVKHLPRQEQAALTANQNSRCHGGHRVRRVAQVQHVSRHLVQVVHHIFKHEGHHHVGYLEDKQRKGEVEVSMPNVFLGSECTDGLCASSCRHSSK